MLEFKNSMNHSYASGGIMASIYHKNSKLAWNGNSAYHDNGKLAWNGSSAYHDNGKLAWNGNSGYHSNGKLAWNGSSAYHDDGKLAGNAGIEVTLGTDIRMYVGKSGFTLTILGNKIV